MTDDHRELAGEGPTIALRSGGLATSSTTVRRWRVDGVERHQIVDPRSGRPAPGVWRTASVAAATCVDGNAASTAAIVLGEEAPAWLARTGLAARLVRNDGGVVGIGSGVTSLLLLTGVVVLGIRTSRKTSLPSLPRFATMTLHPSISLLTAVFVSVHVGTAVLDPYAQVRLLDTVVPFVGSWQSLMLGLGTLGLDVFAAVIVSSLLMRHNQQAGLADDPLARLRHLAARVRAHARRRLGLARPLAARDRRCVARHDRGRDRLEARPCVDGCGSTSEACAGRLGHARGVDPGQEVCDEHEGPTRLLEVTAV